MNAPPEIRNRPLTFFTGGILLSSLILSPFVLDFTLNTRFICLCVTLLLTAFYLHRQKTSEIQLSLPVILYTLFIAVCFAGIPFALNSNEAVAESAKALTGWALFVCVLLLHLDSGERLTAGLAKISVVISLVLFLVFIIQLSIAGSLKKESMYLVTGLNGHKNLFSSFLFLNFCFLLYSRKLFSDRWKLLLLLGIIADLIVMIVLRTKAVYVGIACSILFYGLFYLISKKTFSRKVLLITGLLLLTGANIFFIKVLPWTIDRSLEGITIKSDDPSLLSMIDEERLQLWKKSYHMIRQHPVFGTGPGNWQVHFPDATLSGIWRAEDLNFTFQRPHNDFLWILCETGLAGLNLWLALLFSLLLILLRAAQLVAEKSEKQNLGILASAILGFSVMSFFDFPRERFEHLAWFSIILAIAISSVRTQIAFKNISVKNKYVLPLLMACAGFGAVTGIARYSGELFTRKMYSFKSSGSHNDVISAGNTAYNFFYTLDPTSVPLPWYTGNAYASAGNFLKAYGDLQLAYRLNPFNRNVLNDLASAHVFQGDTSSAITYYKEASRISPRYDEPKLNLAAIYIARKNYARADSCLSTIMHDSDRRSRYQAIVTSLRATGKN